MRKAVDRALNGQTVNGLTRRQATALISAVVDQQS
jgi:hypothetical protein